MPPYDDDLIWNAKFDPSFFSPPTFKSDAQIEQELRDAQTWHTARERLVGLRRKQLQRAVEQATAARHTAENLARENRQRKNLNAAFKRLAARTEQAELRKTLSGTLLIRAYGDPGTKYIVRNVTDIRDNGETFSAEYKALSAVESGLPGAGGTEWASNGLFRNVTVLAKLCG